MELKFSLLAWSAWSARRSSKAAWEGWANGREVSEEYAAPDVSSIPSMKRRRMSTLSRMAIATALDCLGESTEKPICVFGSRHGELTRTIRIINSIVAGKDISPTDFSLSVHNTALGLYSIHTGNNLPATTVVAGADTFAMTFLEALVHLHRFPGKPVLLVYFDEPAPEPLSVLNLEPEEPVCIALLLSGTEPQAIAVSRESVSGSNAGSSAGTTGFGTTVLRFLLRDDPECTIAAGSATWSWRRLV